MGRRKLPMQLITCERKLRDRFKKRKKGLKKAALELSSLCGVDIGMIIYRPPHSKGSSDQPIIWPKNKQEVVSGLIESYKSRSGKTYNLSDYFKEKTKTEEDELKKLREKVREIKYPMPEDDKYNCMSLEDLKQFHAGLTAKIDAVRGRINLMKGSTSLFAESDFSMNQYSVQESGVYVPSMWNCDQMVHYDSLQANMDNQMMMMMMMNNGALSGQGSYSNYDVYGFHEIGAQNLGLLGTGITENYDMSNGMYSFDEDLSNYAYGFGTGMTENVLMSYNAQNVDPLGQILF